MVDDCVSYFDWSVCDTPMLWDYCWSRVDCVAAMQTNGMKACDARCGHIPAVICEDVRYGSVASRSLVLIVAALS